MGKISDVFGKSLEDEVRLMMIMMTIASTKTKIYSTPEVMRLSYRKQVRFQLLPSIMEMEKTRGGKTEKRFILYRNIQKMN
jgi:hypothetical protein